MTSFLSAALVALAGCAALGTIPPALLAARARNPGLAVMALAVAAFVMFVLLAAAVTLLSR